MLADERAQPVDLAHLARYTGGDIALNGEILRLFQIQTRDLIAQLYDSLEAGNTIAWRDVPQCLRPRARRCATKPGSRMWWSRWLPKQNGRA